MRTWGVPEGVGAGQENASLSCRRVQSGKAGQEVVGRGWKNMPLPARMSTHLILRNCKCNTLQSKRDSADVIRDLGMGSIYLIIQVSTM